MKNVLFIAPFEPKGRFNGGISNFAHTIVNNNGMFQKNNINVVPFSNCMIKRASNTNGKIRFGNFVNFIKTRNKLKKITSETYYDAIYLNTSCGISLLKDLFTLRTINKKKSQVILHIHFAEIDNVLTKKILIRKLIISQIKKKVTNVVFLSKSTRDEFENLKIKGINTSVCYNFTDIDLTKMESKASEKCLTSKELNFLFVGSLEKRKGFYDLLKVFDKAEVPFKLTVCGKPIETQSKEEVNKARDPNYFIYKGYITGNEKENAFKDADVMILPSYSEGQPITLLEAMQYGLGIITTDVGSIPEIIDDNNGFVNKPGDITALKLSINKYTENRKLLLQHKNKNLLVSKQFTFESYAEKFIDLINTYSK